MDLTSPPGLTVATAFSGAVVRATLARPATGNALDPGLVAGLREVLETADVSGARVLVVDAEGDRFCSGMDLTAAAERPEETDGSAFWELMSQMRETGVIVTVAVDGSVSGGGVGLVAAADIVFATPRSTFALPEALWGLLPCCVAPFLQERVGPAVARRMTLLTTPLSAVDARSAGLADDIVESLDDAVRQLTLRVRRVDRRTHLSAKRFFRDLPPQFEQARDHALGELARLVRSDLVTGNLTRFAQTGAYPWEGR